MAVIQVQRLERGLGRTLGRCISRFDLISEGDRVMVCVSGGKDSYTLLHLLERARRRSPVKFELVAVHLDQGQPGHDSGVIGEWLAHEGYAHRIVCEDTFAIVKSRVAPGATYCALCSRLRRGVLYNVAVELGCNKVALGHHRDDAIETLLLNLFFAGVIKAMPPKLVSDDGRNVVIRPLLLAAERDIAELARALAFPILPCNVCGSQENLMRARMKRLLNEIEVEMPRVRESLLAALGNVRPTHLLDVALWAKLGIEHARREDGASRSSGDAQAAKPG